MQTFRTALLGGLWEFSSLFQSGLCGHWADHSQVKSWRLLWSTASHHSQVKCKGKLMWDKISWGFLEINRFFLIHWDFRGLVCLLVCLFCKVIGLVNFFWVFRLTIFKINIGLWLSVRCNMDHMKNTLILDSFYWITDKAIWETFFHYHSIQRLCREQELEDVGLVINKSCC